MKLYIDAIWSLNFLFDSLLLLCTALILKREANLKRVFLAGFIGSLIILAPFTPMSSYFSSPIIRLFFSFLMVWIAFGFKTPRYFLSNLFTFYLCTFAAGGALFGFHYLISFNLEFSMNMGRLFIEGFGDPISWLFVFIVFPIALFFSKATFNRYETAKLLFDQIVQVELSIGGKTMVLKGLVDSGNQLYDPFSKRPVMIVSLEKTKKLIPDDLYALFTNLELLGSIDTKILEQWQISVIPYRVVGREHQLLIAIKPDDIKIQLQGKSFERINAIVAFVNQQLSSDDSYDAILHPKMLNEGKNKVS